MKTLSALLFSLAVLTSSAQEVEFTRIFANTHGLAHNGMRYFEVEGQTIYATTHQDREYDEKGIKKIKRKYKIPKKAEAFTNPGVGIDHQYFLTSETIADGLVQKSVSYMLPTANNKVTIIDFYTLTDRDLALESLFVNSLAGDSLPKGIISATSTDSIDFAGRMVYLGGACRWMDPHNVQCPGYGQISWSLFRNLNDARNYEEIKKKMTANRKMGELLGQEYVNVIFEGKETRALKMKYKVKVPEFIMGGSNILIIYYVTEEIRSNYITCVMSHYTDQTTDDGLAPLLSEVMELAD